MTLSLQTPAVQRSAEEAPAVIPPPTAAECPTRRSAPARPGRWGSPGRAGPVSGVRGREPGPPPPPLSVIPTRVAEMLSAMKVWTGVGRVDQSAPVRK